MFFTFTVKDKERKTTTNKKPTKTRDPDNG